MYMMSYPINLFLGTVVIMNLEFNISSVENSGKFWAAKYPRNPVWKSLNGIYHETKWNPDEDIQQIPMLIHTVLTPFFITTHSIRYVITSPVLFWTTYQSCLPVKINICTEYSWQLICNSPNTISLLKHSDKALVGAQNPP